VTRFLSSLTLVALLALPSAAHADRRDLYTSLEVSPQLLRLDAPLSPTPSVFAPAVEAGVVAYYGLTNSIHVGAALRYAYAQDASFNSAVVGGQSGTTYENFSSISAALVAAYRFDLGRRLAPIAQLEVGFASLNYTAIAQVPDAAPYSMAYPDYSETRLEVRILGRAEYQLTDHLVASAGVGVILHPGGLNPWTATLPLTFGWIW
jgi:hypothetical protein